MDKFIAVLSRLTLLNLQAQFPLISMCSKRGEREYGGERKLSDNAVSWFAELDGIIYYTTFIKEGEFKLYEAKPDGEDPYLLQEQVQNVRVMKGKLVCQLSENQDYGLELLDRTGRLLLSVADPISRVLISDDSLLLKSSQDSSTLYLH